MLDPEISPVHRLVAPWWTAKVHPKTEHVAGLRRELTQAALAELKLLMEIGVTWDPFSDARVLWGAEYLNRIGNRRYWANPDLRARAAWTFDPPALLCGKDRSAGAT